MTNRSARVALCTVLVSIATLAAAGCGAASSSGAPSAGGGATGHASSAAPAASGSAGTGSAGAASSGNPAPVPTSTATGNPVPGSPACAGWPAGAPHGTMPATFIPVTVLRCVTGDKEIPGKGLYFAATLERSDGNLAALATVLRQPSGHVQQGTMCPMIAMVAPQIVLIAKDGAKFSPKFPVSGCGMIASPVLRALNALPWQVVSVRVFARVSGGATPSAGATTDPEPTDLIPGPAKKGVNKPGPGGPAR